MIRKIVVTAAMLLTCLAAMPAAVFAEVAKDTIRTEKLEERVRELESRMAKVEASSHKQMGMMDHEHAMQGKGAGTNNAMGQIPQQVPQANPGMTQGGAQQPQQGGAMQPGGMGDM